MMFTSKSAVFLAVSFALSGISGVLSQADTDTYVATSATGSATSTSVVASGMSNLNPCLLQCAQDAATNAGCSDSMEIDCICSSETFQSEVETCLQNNCPASVVSQAAALQTQECTGASGTSATATGSTSRNLESTGASTRTTFSGSIQYTTSATSATASGANGSAASYASAATELTIQTSGLFTILAVFTGMAFGALVI